MIHDMQKKTTTNDPILRHGSQHRNSCATCDVILDIMVRMFAISNRYDVCLTIDSNLDTKSRVSYLMAFDHLSRPMGKPTICLGENKGADQLRSNCEADQRLYFRYSDSTVPLLLKSEISRF